MSRIRGSVRILSMVGITVIGDNDDLVTVRLRRLDHVAHAGVHRFDRLDDRIVNAGMSHHVAVGEVQADEIEFFLVQLLDQSVLYGEGIRIRSSPPKVSSRPPFRKNVTCAYFSVSAMRN